MNRVFEQRIGNFIAGRFRELDHTRAAHVERLELMRLLHGRNPYLDTVKHRGLVSDVINALLDGSTTSLDEELFDGFLYDLAIFISGQMCGGRQSAIPGIDIELERDEVRYLITVKSGKAWGNQSHKKTRLRENFSSAIGALRQNPGVGRIQPTVGICYGRLRKKNSGAYLRIYGKDFWELISGDADLYKDIVEPIRCRAREFDEVFHLKRAHAMNRLAREFIRLFCMADGSIDWPRIVTHVSKTS